MTSRIKTAIKASGNNIIFDGICIGYYIPDLVINDNIIVELKTGQSITNGAKVQLQKYTKYSEHALI